MQWDNFPRLWVEGLEIGPHLPVLKPLWAKPQTQGDTWPFCSFFTISSKSSVFSEDSVWPVEWKQELQRAVRVTGNWGKGRACLGREEEGLSRFWEHPWLNQGLAKGQPSNQSRVPTGPLSFVSEAEGVWWVNQKLYWSVLPRRSWNTTLSKTQGWEDKALLLLLFSTSMKLQAMQQDRMISYEFLSNNCRLQFANSERSNGFRTWLLTSTKDTWILWASWWKNTTPPVKDSAPCPRPQPRKNKKEYYQVSVSKYQFRGNMRNRKTC